MRVLRWRRLVPVLLVLGGVLLALDLLLVLTLGRGHARTGPVSVPALVRPATTVVPATTTAVHATTRPTTRPAPAPAPVAMSWDDAGAIVWHAHDADPVWLGRTLRAAGFGWVAVFLGNDGVASPPDPGWIARLRQAGGLAVGGWGGLGSDPAADAALAVRLIERDGLSFYIADAEAPYEGSGFGRSAAFVAAFRAAEPTLPAALSSFCNAGALDLRAWAGAGFAFLPQAYVNDFGSGVSPSVCVRAAETVFPVSAIHPTVGSYYGRLGRFAPARLARLLARAGTTGFSVFPGEVAMSADDWEAYGRAIATLHIASRVPAS